MQVPELETLLDAVPEGVRNYALYLACPDKAAADNADELTAIVGGVEICTEQGQARLYPPFSVKASEETQCLTLDALLFSLSDNDARLPDIKLMVELPLLREDSVSYQTTLVPVVQMHIGKQAQEVWLLLAAIAEFPANALPD